MEEVPARDLVHDNGLGGEEGGREGRGKDWKGQSVTQLMRHGIG